MLIVGLATGFGWDDYVWCLLIVAAVVVRTKIIEYRSTR